MNKVLKKTIQNDIYRYYGTYKIPFIEKVFPHNIGLKYILLFRKANYFYNSKNILLKYFYWYKLKKMSFHIGFQIHPKTQIGQGFYLGHFGSTVINPEAILGKNVNLAQGVTIGADIRGIRRGSPVIGDFVAIGANASVIGKISIGDDVFIAPNSFVNFDVPNNSIVLGNPGKIIPRENATEGFFVYPVD